MIDKEKVIHSLETCTFNGLPCTECGYYVEVTDNKDRAEYDCIGLMIKDACALLKEQEKEIKALRLLVNLAEECGFGFDQFYDTYERYEDEIKAMNYIDGMIHIAKRMLEDSGGDEG